LRSPPGKQLAAAAGSVRKGGKGSPGGRYTTQANVDIRRKGEEKGGREDRTCTLTISKQLVKKKGKGKWGGAFGAVSSGAVLLQEKTEEALSVYGRLEKRPCTQGGGRKSQKKEEFSSLNPGQPQTERRKGKLLALRERKREEKKVDRSLTRVKNTCLAATLREKEGGWGSEILRSCGKKRKEEHLA